MATKRQADRKPHHKGGTQVFSHDYNQSVLQVRVTALAKHFVLNDRPPNQPDFDPSIVDSAASRGAVDSDPAEVASKNLFAMGRKRSRVRRLLKLVSAVIALVIAVLIFWNIYSQTLEPGFEWKWPE